MFKNSRLRFLALVLVTALVAAACGGTEDVASVGDAADAAAEVVEGNDDAEAEAVAETTTQAPETTDLSNLPSTTTTTEVEQSTTTAPPTEEAEPDEGVTTTTGPDEVEEDEVADEATTTTEAVEETTTTTEAVETTTTEAPVEETTTTTTEAPESTTEAPAPGLDGQVLYESNCARCHQADGSGSRGPNIQGVADASVVTNIVTNGGFGMPAFPQLSAEEVEAIAAHVVTGL